MKDMNTKTSHYISSLVYTECSFAAENIAQNVISAKFRLLYSQLAIALAGSFACATIIYFSIPFSSIPSLKPWYLGMIILTFLRLLLLIHYNKHSQTSSLCPKPYIYLFFITALLTAINWGLLGSFMMPLHDPLSQMIIVIVIAGISAGSAQSL